MIFRATVSKIGITGRHIIRQGSLVTLPVIWPCNLIQLTIRHRAHNDGGLANDVFSVHSHDICFGHTFIAGDILRDIVGIALEDFIRSQLRHFAGNTLQAVNHAGHNAHFNASQVVFINPARLELSQGLASDFFQVS